MAWQTKPDGSIEINRVTTLYRTAGVLLTAFGFLWCWLGVTRFLPKLQVEIDANAIAEVALASLLTIVCIGWGMALVLFRNRFIVNLETGVAAKRISLFGLGRRRSFALDDYSRIAIIETKRGGELTNVCITETVHCLHLEGDHVNPLLVIATSSYAPVREAGVQLARHLGWPLVDRCGEHVTTETFTASTSAPQIDAADHAARVETSPAASAGQSLADIASSMAAPAWRLVMRTEENRVELDLPPLLPPFARYILIAIVVAALVFAVMMWRSYGLFSDMMIMPALGLFFALWFFFGMRLRETIVVEQDAVTFHSTYAFGTIPWRFPITEIRNVTLTDYHRIHAESFVEHVIYCLSPGWLRQLGDIQPCVRLTAETDHKFGFNLDWEEANWSRNFLLRVCSRDDLVHDVAVKPASG